MRHADANEMTTNSAAEHAGVDVETVRFYETSHGVVYDQRPLDFKFVPSATNPAHWSLIERRRDNVP